MKTSVLVLLAASLCLAGRISAADEPKSNTPASLPPQPYTDQGSTTYNTNTSTYGSLYNYGHHGNSFLGGNYMSSTVTVQHRLIYFPPTPPPLGEADFDRRDRATFGKFAPPAALAKDVYESFYAPLSTLLFTEDLSKKRRERLDQYHATRAALLTELRTRLDSLQSAEPASREQGLAALAREQAPRLAALETAAEELRYNFCRGGFFESGSDWNDTREWRLGDDTRWESAIDELKVARAVAAFQEGLSADQRRLLRELQMELADGLKSPTEDISLATPGPFLYFSPATARIRLPAELPDELAAKIASYQQAKAVLKEELRETLYAQDRAFFNYKRVNAFKALAEKQAPQFALVEQLAEEIRRGLAPLPNPARPPVLPLPPGLTPRIASYHQEKLALQTQLVAKLDEVKTALPNDRVEFTRVSDTYSVNVIANRRSSAEIAAKRAALVEALVPFNQEQAARYTKLVREKEAIRLALSRATVDLSASSGSKSIDQLAKEFSFALKKQEIWGLYHDYEIAVLEPGLSPAQRQLLFGAALDKLDLPLAN